MDHNSTFKKGTESHFNAFSCSYSNEQDSQRKSKPVDPTQIIGMNTAFFLIFNYFNGE